MHPAIIVGSITYSPASGTVASGAQVAIDASALTSTSYLCYTLDGTTSPACGNTADHSACAATKGQYVSGTQATTSLFAASHQLAVVACDASNSQVGSHALVVYSIGLSRCLFLSLSFSCLSCLSVCEPLLCALVTCTHAADCA